MPVGELLAARFATFRFIHTPTAGRLREHGFKLMPTCGRISPGWNALTRTNSKSC